MMGSRLMLMQQALRQLDALDDLIQTTGAISFQPFALRERAELVGDDTQQGELRAQAERLFEAMGADIATLCPETRTAAPASAC